MERMARMALWPAFLCQLSSHGNAIASLVGTDKSFPCKIADGTDLYGILMALSIAMTPKELPGPHWYFLMAVPMVGVRYLPTTDLAISGRHT
jgi:hypothetical protein